MTNVDVLVIGGGLGGVAAALAAAEAGATVMLVEESPWLGGQLTSQGVCTPDEDPIKENGIDFPVVETSGSTRSYQELKHLCRLFYRTQTQLSAEGQNMNPLNVGRCWVNLGFAVEANVALQALKDMLEARNVAPLMNTRVVDVARDGRQVSSVLLSDAAGNQETVIPKYVLDATETGDLIFKLGMDWFIGAEDITQTGETAIEGWPAGEHPDWIQPITIPFALEHRPFGEDHTIAKPDNYDEVAANHNFSLEDGDIVAMFTKGGDPNGLPFWTYRRVIDCRLFNDPRYRFDVATINVKANDFRHASYPTGDAAADADALKRARELTVCYIYWLQTQAPRDDGRAGPGWPELRPATEFFFDTQSCVAPKPYIRESRRIKPKYQIKQQDLDAELQPGPRAKFYADSCGVGNYKMDVHAGANGGLEMVKLSKPYQIPAGALVPNDMDNVLAAGKCLGVTHITNGAYRLHPQEWNIGQSAGLLAAYAISRNLKPSEVLDSGDETLGYQKALLDQGVPIFWWKDVPVDHPQFKAIQMMGIRQIFGGFPNTVDFRPNDNLPTASQESLQAALGVDLGWPVAAITRAAAAQHVAEKLGLV